jgi:hypothetical protein
MRRRLLLLAVPLVVLMAACGADDDSGGASTSPPASSAPAGWVPSTSGPDRTLTTVPGSVTPSTGGSASPTTTPAGGSDEEQAIADLAASQGVAPSAITTVSVEEVTWRSGAIGCPQPGFNYTQALVPGIRVILELDGKRYEYHSGGGRSIFLCENPEPPVEG